MPASLSSRVTAKHKKNTTAHASQRRLIGAIAQQRCEEQVRVAMVLTRKHSGNGFGWKPAQFNY